MMDNMVGQTVLPSARASGAFNTDVLIAGGGPGGLAAAEAAARAGLSVAVIERNSEIGSPTRTSGGSFIQDMAGFGIPKHLYHPVRVCRFVGPNTCAEFA